MNIELFINHNNKLYQPIVEEGVMWETERKGSPGKLTFTVVKDSIIDFTEGDAVRLRVDEKEVFFGYVFSKRRDKEHRINVTAYDQIRYLKNKYSYITTNFTATDMIRRIADDFMLQTGYLEDTKYVMESSTNINSTLLDMIQTTLETTTQNTGELYVLYDDFGKLTLKNVSSMTITDILIDSNNSSNFDYTSSIDEQTYNRIKLYYDNKEVGKREIYLTQDGDKINRWGILEYCAEEKNSENLQVKADALLKLYGEKTRHLNINNALGDLRVRAGCMIPVTMYLGDLQLNNMMLVEKCRHEFYESQHLMDLTLRGGITVAEFEQ